MSGFWKKSVVIVIHLLILTVEGHDPKKKNYYIAFENHKEVTQFTHTMTAHFVIIFEKDWNETSLIIPQWQKPLPFDNFTINWQLPVTVHVRTSEIDSENVVLLGVECSQGIPPFQAHPEVENFLERFFTGMNHRLSAYGVEIPSYARLSIFYSRNKDFISCDRQRHRLYWELIIPIREMKGWETTKIFPIPFKTENTICRWNFDHQFVLKRAGSYFLLKEDETSCKEEKVCRVSQWDERQLDFRCYKNGDCPLACDSEEESKFITINNDMVLVASFTPQILIMCNDQLVEIDNTKDGAILITLNCSCAIINTKIHMPSASCHGELKWEHLPSPLPPSITSAVTRIRKFPVPIYDWVNRFKKTDEHNQILKSINWVFTVEVLNFLSPLIIFGIAYMILYLYRMNGLCLFGSMMYLMLPIGAVHVNIGPQSLYPELPPKDDQALYITILVFLSIILTLAIIILCMLRFYLGKFCFCR